MTAENSITLWHLEENKMGFSRKFFPKAHFHIKEGFAKSGIKEKGFHPSNTVVARIPTTDYVEVFPGDYIQPGECTGNEPDYRNAFKVTAVSDNRRGVSPHWKLFCGGQR